MIHATAGNPHKAAQLPDFIVNRVDRYEADTIRAEHCAHTLIGGAPLAPGDIDLRSNDYLALGRHPEVIEAQVAQLRASANEQMMSAVFLTEENAQWRLENRFAELMQAGAAVMFQSGYVANTALLQSIADASTPVYLDMMAHASLYQGVSGAGAQLYPFRHNDVVHLMRQVRTHGPGIVAIDSVYSTDGSVAPIEEIARVANLLGCALIVDESHSLGTHGPQGAGLVVELGLQERVHFRTASLAKALCGRAGLVTCPRELGYYLHRGTFSNIFSSAILPHELAALGKTLDLVQRDGWRRTRLHDNAAWLRARLDELGYNVSASGSQIVSLEAGPEESLIRVTRALAARGVVGAPFFAPATAKNRACLRLSVHAGLSDADLERIADACAEIRDEVELSRWASTLRKARHAGVREERGEGRQESRPVRSLRSSCRAAGVNGGARASVLPRAAASLGTLMPCPA